MDAAENRAPPRIPRHVVSVATTIVLFFLFLLGLHFIQLIRPLPPESAPFVYGTIAFISLLPILLIVVDLLAANRGVVQWKDFKLDFSQAAKEAPVSLSVPTSLGMPGQPLIDSNTMSILGTLSEAVASEVVVVDLAGGQAWWETRLLVLAAGAASHDRPRAIVFTATEADVTGVFQGWARPADLVRLLLNQDHRYAVAYERAEAAWRQWQLVEPTAPLNAPLPAPQVAGGPPPSLPWFQPVAGNFYGLMAFTPEGSRNDLAFEQILQSQLGELVESQGSPTTITPTRLRDVFPSVLHVDAIEQTAGPAAQIAALATGIGEYVALVRDGRYRRLLPRVSVLGIVIQSLTAGRDSTTR
jgi:hypothetical protein